MTKELGFNISRWIVFGLVALAIIIPVIIADKMPLPDSYSKVVRNIYDKIDSLPPGSPIVISVDFDPSSDEELRPMVKALLRHAFRKNLRVMGMTVWDPAAGGTLIDIFTEVAKENNKQDGIDFAIMPYKPGGSSVILLLAQNIFEAYPKDYKNNACKDLPVFKGIKSLKDMKLAMEISAGSSADLWIIYGKEKGKIPLGIGCTAVMATDYYPYLQSGQLLGLMGGLSSAAQYETLIDTSSPEVKSIYSKIKAMSAGSPIILSIDYLPDSDRELGPETTEIVKHAFKKDLRVIAMSISSARSVELATTIISALGKEYNKKEGIDYAIMPFNSGGSSVIPGLYQDFFSVYPKDNKDASTKDLPVFKGIKSIKDVYFIMSISTNSVVDTWINCGKAKGIPLGIGCTKAMSADYNELFKSRQIVGVLGGLEAAAQYKVLVEQEGTATKSMKPQTVVHALIIILIIIGNIIYFTGKKKPK